MALSPEEEGTGLSARGSEAKCDAVPLARGSVLWLAGVAEDESAAAPPPPAPEREAW